MNLQAESLGWDTLGGSGWAVLGLLISAVLTHVCVQLAVSWGSLACFGFCSGLTETTKASLVYGFLSPSYLTECLCGSILKF